MKKASLLVVLFFFCVPVEAEYLYRTMLVRAAPGELTNVIEMYQRLRDFYRAAGDEVPFWMRHSQGDHWDLMFLYPMGSFEAYYAPDRVQRRAEAARRLSVDPEALRRQFYDRVSWHEEVYVSGPPLEQVRAAFEGAAFFHVEMFRALPGRYHELVEQRRMENRYLKELARPQNLIFIHEQGADWDVFTLGCYRSLSHFAESDAIPAEKEEEAARKAGFASASDIGLYLRRLIASHNDTLAVAIR